MSEVQGGRAALRSGASGEPRDAGRPGARLAGTVRTVHGGREGFALPAVQLDQAAPRCMALAACAVRSTEPGPVAAGANDVPNVIRAAGAPLRPPVPARHVAPTLLRYFFFLMTRRPQGSSLFPNTTLSR